MRTRMPYDSKKPPIPGKIAATPKVATRSKPGVHVTPRLAASPTSAASPIVGKEQRTPGIGSTVAAAPERISTPVKNFLNSNITPRSSSRKARVDSAPSTPRSTPNGTPSSSRPTSIVASQHDFGPTHEGFDLGLSPNMSIGINKLHNTLTCISNPQVGRNTSVSPDEFSEAADSTLESPKFFYASDASNTLPVRQTSQGSAVSKTGFVYADGRREPSRQPVVPVQKKSESKFCYANGLSKGGQNSVRSPTSTSPTTTQRSAQYNKPAESSMTRNRSTSPLKEFELPSTQTAPRMRRSSGISHFSLQSSRGKPNVTSVAPKTVVPKLQPYTVTHSKTHSLSSLVPDKQPSTVESSIHSVQSPQSLPEVATSHSPTSVHAKTNITSPVSPLVSPTRHQSVAGEGNVDQLNSSASNARRERKVLDLEISNSSLLAINRTLEREMRKQKAELRRFRRLTSSGRLSIAATNRSISDVSTFSISTRLDSDIEEEPEEDDYSSEQLSELDELYDTDASSASSSHCGLRVKDARQRERDERRLRLDLNKHQELLIDSQKMNQSLKRCLGWTEELILEGHKALAYQVRVSDVAVGGRVLHVDEQSEVAHTEPRKALLSPTHLPVDGPRGWPWNIDSSEQVVPLPTSYDSKLDEPANKWTEDTGDFQDYVESLSCGGNGIVTH